MLVAAGAGAAGLAAQGRRLTPFPMPRADARLIQSGIYRLIRHPLYACNLGAFFGWALFRSSVPAGVAGLAGLLFFILKARREEAWLRNISPGYAEYEKHVKRFLPWIY